ncbi:MAG TPA: phosphatase PAP2 family protein [Thermoleophilaceae bacterium]|nr:phosphatase PAP2 family protein [Thermoleophilaceae bacterium]
MTRTLDWSSRWLPQGWFDALRQLTLFAGAYYAYRIVRGFTDGSAAAAFDNARTLVHAERGLGLFFEPSFQHWAMGMPWLVDIGNWAYVNTHFVVTTSFLIWLYLARNSAFYFVRNMFVIAMALALVGYTLYPAAPPRLLPDLGFTDTVSAAVGHNQAHAASVLFNPYAAMPSMHVGFALMIAIPAIRLVRTRALRAVWAVYPAFVTFVVVVTANHFWIDGAFGALVAGVSAYGAYLLGRARPAAWAWRTPEPEEPARPGLGAEAPA